MELDEGAHMTPEGTNRVGHISTMLPLTIRNALIQASGVDPFRSLGESDKRILALAAAIAHAKHECPQLFR